MKKEFAEYTLSKVVLGESLDNLTDYVPDSARQVIILTD
jgi:hypothetical protein